MFKRPTSKQRGIKYELSIMKHQRYVLNVIWDYHDRNKCGWQDNQALPYSCYCLSLHNSIMERFNKNV